MNTNSQKILTFLHTSPPVTLSAIADATGIEPGELGTCIGQMMRAGEVRQGSVYDGGGFRYEAVRC
jgi:DNA-binding IclR family transcriptional regulator